MSNQAPDTVELFMRIQKSLRLLQVWLAVLTCGIFFLVMSLPDSPNYWSSQGPPAWVGQGPPAGLPGQSRYVSNSFAAGWDEMGPDDCIAAASAILYCRNETTNNTLTPVVERVVLCKPGAQPPYAVGDRVAPSWPRDTRLEENADYGEGHLVFFAGSPPEITLKCYVHGGRIGAFGDMPLEVFLDKASAAGAAKDG